MKIALYRVRMTVTRRRLPDGRLYIKRLIPSSRLCPDYCRPGSQRGVLVAIHHPTLPVCYQIVHGPRAMHARLAAQPFAERISPLMGSASDLRAFFGSSAAGISSSERGILVADGLGDADLSSGARWGDILQSLTDRMALVQALRKTRHPALMAAASDPSGKISEEALAEIKAMRDVSWSVAVDHDAIRDVVGRLASERRTGSLAMSLETI